MEGQYVSNLRCYAVQELARALKILWAPPMMATWCGSVRLLGAAKKRQHLKYSLYAADLEMRFRATESHNRS